jgi:hypothetical protein
MTDWSDFGRCTRPPGGPVLLHLVDRAVPSGGRALVVGPHEWDLVDIVVGRAERTTILLRGQVDAAAAADRYRGPGVNVICGDFSALDDESPVDVFVALDGLERVVSLESGSPTWHAVFARLTAALAPRAAVLLTVDNALSVSEFGAVPSRESRDDDTAWRPLDLYDRTRPSSLEQLSGLLEGSAAWALHPSTRRPSLVARPGPLPEALVVAHNAGAGMKVDPQTAMRTAVLAGRADEFAAGWTLVKATSPTPVVAGVFANGAGRVSEVRTVGDRFTVSPVAGKWEVAGASAWVATPPREQTLVADASLLESVLLDACARRDIATIRTLVRRMLTTLRACEPAELGRWVAGTFDNVVMHHDETLTLLDAAWAYNHPVSPDDVMIQLCGDFARRLFDLGWRHPWPTAARATEVTMLLAAAAGIETEPETIAAQRGRQEELDSLRGRSRRPVPGADQDAATRASAVNDALRSKVAWFEAAIIKRDADLADHRTRAARQQKQLRQRVRRLEKQLDELSGSTSYRVSRALMSPARALKRRRGTARGPDV